LTTLASELPFSTIPTIYYKCIDIAHKRKDLDDQTLFAPSQALMQRMESFKNQRPAQYLYLSPSEWTKEYERLFIQTFGLIQTNIYRNTGHWDEAMTLANRVQQHFNSNRLN